MSYSPPVPGRSRPGLAHRVVPGRRKASRPAIAWLALLALGVVPAAAIEPLDLEDRIACRGAIEQVQWRHRTWPAANRSPKPSFAAVVSPEALRREAERTILLSSALDRFWRRPVGEEELRAELRRIFRDSRAPARLREIARALGGDGYVLAECLARPLLVERLARSYYAGDERFGGAGRGPTFDEWLESVRPLLASEAQSDPAAWVDWRLDALEALAAPAQAGAWSPTAALPESTIHETAVWTGSEMIVWGGGVDTGSRYDPATDTWRSTAAIGAPSPRANHTAVWTGTEMIVWGGCGQGSNFCELASGGRYDPVADSWQPVAPTPISARRFHTAVWTGDEMIVWGGCTTGSFGNRACELDLGNGGRYDPAADAWIPMSVIDEPSRRKGHTAVWTGDRMVIWGGYAGVGPTGTGGLYDPATDAWSPTSTASAPGPRAGHTAVWTGDTMIVWGGCDNSFCGGGTVKYGDGGRYDPAANAWAALPLAGAPDARADHTAIWSGTEMIVWGGEGQDGLPRATGGRYAPASGAWSSTQTTGAPSARALHRAVWTGQEMIVWGRLDPQGRKSGGRYDPSTDTWVPTSVNDPRLPRASHVAVWTGSEMLIWGGQLGGGFSGVGDRYDPATDSWRPMSDAGEPMLAEHGGAAVWSGTEMIVWGGQIGTSVLATGGRYDPATDTWQPTTTSGAPIGRAYHVMVWAGGRMFVWGGITTSSVTATGALYDPAEDAWTPTTLAGAPAGRAYAPGASTGSHAIVWGGHDGLRDLDSGGIYDPSSDSWVLTATAGAPSPRHFHTALWTGTRLLVWGGSRGALDEANYLSSGGLYDPGTGAWTPTTELDAPAGRIFHAGVWTGSEMIVWGGCNGPANCGNGLFTGARYSPPLDRWLPTPLQSAPSARDHVSGVWTGSSLIVWGGYADTYGSYTSTGGVLRDWSFADGFESGDASAWGAVWPP